MVPRLRICLPMQGTWVPFLVQEDSTCLEASKPMDTTAEARVPRALAPRQKESRQ